MYSDDSDYAPPLKMIHLFLINCCIKMPLYDEIHFCQTTYSIVTEHLEFGKLVNIMYY